MRAKRRSLYTAAHFGQALTHFIAALRCFRHIFMTRRPVL
jgi:hypothetical protein